jgi:hypothetical protein
MTTKASEWSRRLSMVLADAPYVSLTTCTARLDQDEHKPVVRLTVFGAPAPVTISAEDALKLGEFLVDTFKSLAEGANA